MKEGFLGDLRRTVLFKVALCKLLPFRDDIVYIPYAATLLPSSSHPTSTSLPNLG